MRTSRRARRGRRRRPREATPSDSRGAERAGTAVEPQPFSQQGQTQVVPRTDIQVDEEMGKKLLLLNEGVSLQELINGLNALGVGPRDMISILQAIKAAGALQAEIEVIG